MLHQGAPAVKTLPGGRAGRPLPQWALSGVLRRRVVPVLRPLPGEVEVAGCSATSGMGEREESLRSVGPRCPGVLWVMLELCLRISLGDSNVGTRRF